MATSNNPLFDGVSGKLGNVIVKQYGDKTVISSVPDMSRRKLSAKQKEANSKMKQAISAAQNLTASPRLIQRACDVLGVPANKVFRAIVKEYLKNGGRGPLFGESEQDTTDKQTLATLKSTIKADIPDAEIKLFGDRGKGSYNEQSDWDILILTTTDYPNTAKWQLQEKLFAITIQQGARVNLLLAQKNKWKTDAEYELIRNRIGAELLPVK